MNVHEVGSAVQTVAGGELDVTTVANWGEWNFEKSFQFVREKKKKIVKFVWIKGVGGISVEVYLGTNHDIKDKHAFALKGERKNWTRVYIRLKLCFVFV